MTITTTVLVSLCAASIVVGIAHIMSVETGQMVLIEHLKEDWGYRLPFRLRNNRYRGLSRPSYQFFVILYYLFKAIIIIILCAYSYLLVGIVAAIKWVWREIQRSINSRTTHDEQEDDFGIAENNNKTDERTHSASAKAQPSNNTQQLTFSSQSPASSNNVISSLWNHGSEIQWHEALDYYYESLKIKESELDRYMENVDADEIAQLSVDEFYDFLYDKYYVWKYTDPRRLAKNRKSLKQYVDENKLAELADIQKRLFSTDCSNIERSLRIAVEIRGLGPAGASGLLSILFPENFGTVDQYVVKALREVEGIPYHAELAKMNPDSLSIKDGVLLIQIFREQAARLNEKFNTDFWTPRKIDMVFWSIGRVRK